MRLDSHPQLGRPIVAWTNPGWYTPDTAPLLGLSVASIEKLEYPLTKRQQHAYDRAYGSALKKAGGVARLAHELSVLSDTYITHQAIRNWRKTRRIPPQWALVMEDYHEAANFFDLVPWLRDRADQELSA